MPNKNDRNYPIIKKACYSQHPMQSQVVTYSVLKNPKAIGGVCTKVAAQMCAKV